MNFLGIHGGVTLNQHDAGAALICDGKVVAAIEEERILRMKGAYGQIPIRAISACLKHAGLTMNDIDGIVHPGETYDDMPGRIRDYIAYYFGYCPPVEMINHQMAHLASAYFHAPADDTFVLSYDAYGDRLSGAYGIADSEKGVEILGSFPNSNSLGMFYATMTSYLGFMPGEDEFKVMGLAAYGKEKYDLTVFAKPTAEGYRVDPGFIRSDPAPKSRLEPYYSQKLVDLLGEPRRLGEPIDERLMDVAFATQQALEACAISLVEMIQKKTGRSRLALAGGVGLNCSANLKLDRLPSLKDFFVQPASSDRGLALGCAYHGAFAAGDRPEPLSNVYLGPSSSAADDTIRAALDLTGMAFRESDAPEEETARWLAEGKIVGWFQGRSEFGPRALGNRSILADPRSVEMKDVVNARVKFREEFRPFAPAALEEEAATLFDMSKPSPYMTKAFPVLEEKKATLGAVTHLNGTARVQTVSAESNPRFHAVINAFASETGVPSVMNTSFNIKGQPIVETPLEAISTFASTGLDALVMGNFIVEKQRSPRA